MKLVNQRARIGRIRRIQHGLAAFAAAKASDHVQMLEANEEKLKQMRLGLGAQTGPTSGAALASRGELAMRLESAREGLRPTIAGARTAARLREEARLEARREQESAEKLEQRAASAAARAEDRRMAARFRPRLRTDTKGD
ncbi:MAG TPA: hypothetical protein VH331_18255 [Allosphingosinicella sp.]|nr:hypothetical protein [Allosphingosinicella sp.]